MSETGFHLIDDLARDIGKLLREKPGFLEDPKGFIEVFQGNLPAVLKDVLVQFRDNILLLLFGCGESQRLAQHIRPLLKEDNQGSVDLPSMISLKASLLSVSSGSR